MAYSGVVVRLPVGAQGFNGTRNPSQLGPGHLTYANGVEIYGGILRKEGGASRFNSEPLEGSPAIISGINWSPAGALFRDVVMTSAGDVIKDNGAGLFETLMASGLVADRDPPPYFMTAGGESVGKARTLFLFSASNQVHAVDGDGDTLLPLDKPADDWSSSFPTFGVAHIGRVFAGGNSNDPHRIYYSTLEDNKDFKGTGSGTLSIYPGEGEGLIGGISFKGALVLWKYPSGIYVVYTPDGTPSNWQVARVTRAVGGVNQHTIIQVDNDVLYMDAAGSIHALSATQEFGDLATSNISRAMELEPFMRRNVNRALIKRAVGTWYAAKQQAWFSVTQFDQADNDLRIVLGFETGSPRIFMSRRDHSVSIWMRPDPVDNNPRPVIGDNEGTIWLLDRDSRDKDGNAYEMRFETSDIDFQFADPAFATRSKNGHFLEIVSEPSGDWDLTVEVYWDDMLVDVLAFSMGVGGAPLGQFTLDSDVFASETVSSQRKRLPGSGRRLKLICYNAGLGQDVSISDFYVSIVPGDERVREVLE